jgi:hypothetical protein
VPSTDTIYAGERFRDPGTGLKILDPKPSAPHPKLREVAGKTVGSAFYGTIFQMMRESPFKSKFGNGGRGEEVFSAQLHGVLAERLGESKQSNLSEVLYRRLEKQQQLIDASKTPKGSEST